MGVHAMKRWGGLGAASALLAAGLAVPSAGLAHQKATKKKVTARTHSFATDVKPLVVKYCVQCHSGGSPAAGLALDKFRNEADVMAKSDVWDKVALNVSTGHMPPSGMPAPTKAQRNALVTFLQSLQAQSCKLPDPGRVTMRRLNRLEYDNTVRDLTGLDLHLSADFPSDDVGYGFDGIGDVLSISPLLMEKYLRAAETIAKKLVPTTNHLQPTVYEGSSLKNTHNGTEDGDSWILLSNGSVYTDHDFPRAGAYTLRVHAYGQQAGPDPTKMVVRLDKEILGQVDVKATDAKPGTFEYPVRIEAGKHRISAEFINDFYEAGPPAHDRNLVINSIEVAPPSGSGPDIDDGVKALAQGEPLPTDKSRAASLVLRKFASRAFRRPATEEEVARLTQIADLVMKDGEPLERAVQVGVQAVLSSPHFLFRVEKDSGNSKLGAYELASRLSYFLWSSMPDDRLLSLARTGQLSQPDVLQREAKRMLADPRAKALGDGFAAQWLNLRKLAGIVPDPQLFPSFDDKLREAMATETRMFFDEVVRNDRSVLDFIGAKYTYLNEPLAKHYGIAGVTGPEFRKVSLEGTPRAGVLTQASVLTLTSNPTRTSPVKRGKWVLDQLFNTPPPPPPPGVGDLKDDGKVITGATLRQRMEMHRKDPACATCHMRMDPIGFSLENFDATGKWRDMEGDAKVDASGVLPDGTKFNGPDALRGILLKRKGDFVRCLSEKLLTYAIGRGIESADKCVVDEIAAKATASSYRFSALVTSIVTSEPFRMRRPGAAPKPSTAKRAK